MTGIGTRALLFLLSLAPIFNVFSEDSMESCKIELIKDYLRTYHKDYGSLKVDFKHNGDRKLVRIESAAGKRLKNKYFESVSERDLFKLLASLLIEPAESFLQPKDIEGMHNAWFWDYKVKNNPAYFDLLEDAISDHQAQIDKKQAISFWKFKFQIDQAGNRKNWWRQLSKNPQILVPQLDASISMTSEELLFFVDYSNTNSSPVMKMDKSVLFLQQLSSIPLMTHSGKKRVTLNEISKTKLIRGNYDEAYTRAKNRIKENLVRINPSCANALRSIGICYERLLAKDYHGFLQAWEFFEEDLNFSIKLMGIMNSTQ